MKSVGPGHTQCPHIPVLMCLFKNNLIFTSLILHRVTDRTYLELDKSKPMTSTPISGDSGNSSVDGVGALSDSSPTLPIPAFSTISSSSSVGGVRIRVSTMTGDFIQFDSVRLDAVTVAQFKEMIRNEQRILPELRSADQLHLFYERTILEDDVCTLAFYLCDATATTTLAVSSEEGVGSSATQKDGAIELNILVTPFVSGANKLHAILCVFVSVFFGCLVSYPTTESR